LPIFLIGRIELRAYLKGGLSGHGFWSPWSISVNDGVFVVEIFFTWSKGPDRTTVPSGFGGPRDLFMVLEGRKDHCLCRFHQRYEVALRRIQTEIG
jgi:hypothetical protein